jgi:hypothetical protein
MSKAPTSWTIVCGSASRFIHVIVVPALIVADEGENIKFFIVTRESLALCADAVTVAPDATRQNTTANTDFGNE